MRLHAQARNQRAGGLSVILVFGAEGLAHELFFHAEFDGEGQPEQDDRQQASGIGAGKGGANHAKDDAGVDRVADPGVRAGADEFVFDFDADGTAPVLSEVEAGPDGEGDSEGS